VSSQLLWWLHCTSELSVDCGSSPKTVLESRKQPFSSHASVWPKWLSWYAKWLGKHFSGFGVPSGALFNAETRLQTTKQVQTYFSARIWTTTTIVCSLSFKKQNKHTMQKFHKTHKYSKSNVKINKQVSG